MRHDFTRRYVFNRFMALVAVGATLVVAHPSLAEVKVGSKLEPIKLADQHDKEQTVDGKIKYLIFARDMDGSKIITKTLEPMPAARMAEKGIVYVADISRMPSIISKMIAVPKMRKYPYSVVLDRDAVATKELPSKEDHATLITLNELKVEAIDFHDSAESLTEALEAAPK